MLLTATTDIRVSCAQDTPVVAMLRPRSGQAQWVLAQRYELAPWVPAREYVDSYGNLCQRFVVPRGEARIRVASDVEVDGTVAVDVHAPRAPVERLPDDALVYMLQSRYCPSDVMEDQAKEVVKGCAPGYPQAARIEAWIREKLDYRYGVSDASTTALDTLGHGAGVCRDFAHVGISLCRALHLPARFVVGYLYRLDPMDMHAWYEVYLGDRWYTFDATQDRPRGGRIVVAYGRDATDVAFLSSYEPLEITKMQVAVEKVEAGSAVADAPVAAATPAAA
ncbi:MAG: transglutaminase family protein [Comamonadaceae bacterium]|nr:MAG: transglutaminase family protein [Comamonadaceae bacterium]